MLLVSHEIKQFEDTLTYKISRISKYMLQHSITIEEEEYLPPISTSRPIDMLYLQRAYGDGNEVNRGGQLVV